MKLSNTELAREVAKIIRHNPEKLDLEMDDDGWVSLEDLLFGFEQMTPYQIEKDQLKEALTNSNRGRFELSDESDKVRAKVGHTTEKVRYQVVEPPSNVLYRVESARHYGALAEYGIQPMRRKYTEIFESFPAAIKDGKKRRIKNPMVLTIKAKQAYHDGTLFYDRDGSIFVEDVEAAHLELEEVEINSGPQ